MTTITSNGFYLVADKCTSSTKTKDSGNKLAMSGITDVYKTSNNVKIHVVDDKDYTYKDAKILAYAIAGDAIGGERFMKAAEGIPISNFARSYTRIVGCVDTDQNFSVVAVTNFFETLLIDVYGEIENHTSNVIVDIRRKPCGMSVGVGSGHILSNTLLNSKSLCASTLDETHILHRHLFAASCDPRNSSVAYDAYGARECKLFTNLNPEPEAVLESFRIVKDLIKIKPLTLRD